MEINFNENKEMWDDFVSTSPHRSIFVYSKFLDSLGTQYHLVTCYEQEHIVAGVVVLFSDLGEPISTPHPFTMYQGILLSDNSQMKTHSRIPYEKKILKYFINRLIDNFKHCCFCQSWRFTDMQPFQWYNYHEPQKGLFKINLRYTGILELEKYNGFEDYLSSVRTVRRQEFNKSEKLLNLRVVNDDILLDDLHDKTFKRQGIERSPRESFLVKSITKYAILNNYGSLKFAILDDTAISAILFLYDDRTGYYLFGANDPEYRNIFAGIFLLTNMIKDAFERGLKEVDFVGVNSPNRGDYKISFNAELKPYFECSFLY